MEMDLAQLAGQAAAFLAPYLPYLIKGGKIAAKKAFEKAGELFSEEAWEQVEKLWGRLRSKVEKKEAAKEAVQEIIDSPKDEEALFILQRQIRKILAEDPQLAGEAQLIVGQIVNLSYVSQSGDGSIFVGGDVTGSDLLIGRNNRIVHAQTYVEGNVYHGPAPRNPQESLDIYRHVMANATSSLSMRGIDLGASDPTAAQKSISLANVYIALDTKAQKETQEEYEKEKEFRFVGRPEKNRPLTILEAVARNPHLVIKGDPGSGKSMFVNYLTWCLASRSTQRLKDWQKEDADLLPILVILRDFARSLPKKLPPRAEPRHLWDFIRSRLKAQNLTASAEAIRNVLEQGKAILFLDGLDEVATIAQRVFIRDAVHAFVQRYPKNRFVVTCRILSYQPPKSKDDPDLRLASFPEFELAPFDDEKIGAFIEAWYKELAHLKIVPSDLAADSNRSLKKAIHRPELAELAPNPLLLTVMAVVNTHKGRLPDTRAVLYKEAVEILLWRWEQGSKGQEARLRQLLLDAKCQEIDLEQVIWKLAYEAHAQTSETDNKNRTLAGIGELTLQKSLASLNKGDLNWAARVIESMKLRAGLLLERDPGVFSFPHRSFQEFLAGTYLEAQDDFVSRARELADNQLLWRETILWAVSRRVYVRGSTDGPLALVAELCPSRPCCSPEEWSRVWLAGDILLETGLNRVERSELGNELLPRVRTRLVSLLEQSALTPRERAAAGDTLARLGDPRFDDEAWQLPKEGLLGFVHIPAGGFLMGTKEDDIQGLIKKFGGGKDYYKAEVPQHPLALPDYYLARYPVTVAQFKAFVIESGYEPGNEASLQGVDNHPVRYVTWFDAVAYCDWLDQKLKAIAPGKKAAGETEKAFWQGLEDGRLRVTLPSEAEWEKAARGTSLLEGEGRVRAFPWGNEITPNHANYNETGIGSTCAVGCFPRGTSPYGLLDLSGNVWEWTRSIYKEYPYQPDKGRETMDDKKSVRVLRGGAFSNFDWNVRCAYRFRFNPYDEWNYNGFRVVVASPISLPRSGS